MKVTFTKIASTPTSHAWSQTYSAGNFAALIALQHKTKKEEALQTIGREIVTTLEAEYFTLETKNLSSIKKAVEEAALKIPESIHANLIVATVINTTLYAFLFGGGKVYIKRNGENGLLLEKPLHAVSSEHLSQTVTSLSGIVKHNDIIILASDAFLENIPQKDILEQVGKTDPNDAAEAITLQLQKKKEGGACAIIFSLTDELPQVPPDITIPLTDTPIQESPPSEKVLAESPPEQTVEITTRMKFPSFLSHRVLFISLALIILTVIVVNIVITIQKQKQKVLHAQFEKAYTTAQAKYDEGINLVSLNKQAATDDFTQGQTLLTSYQLKFSPQSAEGKQIADLMKKIQDGLIQAKAENLTTSKQASEKDSPLLASEMKDNAMFATQDSDNVYLADSNAVTAFTKDTQKSKVIIKNNNDWSELGGLGTYLGNIYLLDKKSTLLKYVVANSGFGKTNYFGNTKVDVSNAVSIAIDGSVYILFQDGSIKKFTKGQPDTFTLSGLSKPFNQPTRIFTTKDQNNLYILDNGNKRVVVLTKDGMYQSQYLSDLLSQAKDIEVLEKDKKIFILSQNKLWGIDMK